MTAINARSQQASDRPVYDDEIDLTELFAKIWSRKWWVVVSVLVSALLALAYLLVTKPTYRMEAQFRPVLTSELEVINQSEVKALSPEAAMQRAQRVLASKQLRREFFDQDWVHTGFVEDKETALTQEQLFLRFDKKLQLVIPVAKKNQVLASDANQLSFEHSNPEYGVEVVNQALEGVNTYLSDDFAKEFKAVKDQRISVLEKEMKRVVEQARVVREQRIKVLEEENALAIQNTVDQIDALKGKALAQRHDRIAQLEEALAIAKALNIEKPSKFSSFSGVSQTTSSGVAITTELDNGKEPLYLRGVTFLEAELGALRARKDDSFTQPAIRQKEAELLVLKRQRQLQVLKARETDEAHVDATLAPLRKKHAKLSELEIDFSKINFIHVDHYSSVPEKPIKPKKRLIMAAAIVLGGMLGLFVALVVPGRRREEA